jgi:hypothetical protein
MCPHCRTSGSSFTRALAVAATVGLVACKSPTADVYGPAAVNPDARMDASSESSAGPDAHVAGPEVTVYGPAPFVPDDRVAPTPSK